jgi:hypothetical protein
VLALRCVLALLLVSAASALPAERAYDTTPFDRFFVDIIIRAPGALTDSAVEAWLNTYVLAAVENADLRVPLANITLASL